MSEELEHIRTKRTQGVVQSPRFQRTLAVLREYCSADSSVVEIGATDATFKFSLIHAAWKTVDKFGSPDIHADFNDLGLRIPLETDSQDVVICTEVLEHLVSGAGLVREMARLLKPGGIAMVTVPNLVSLGSRIKWVMGRVPFMAASGDCGHQLGGTGMCVDGNWVAGHVVDFNHSRLKAYLARGGLRCVRSISFGASIKGLNFPRLLIPLTFADYVAVVATPQ